MRRFAAITLFLCWGLFQAESVLASLAGCARLAGDTRDSAMDVAAEARAPSGGSGAMALAMADAPAPCHGSGAAAPAASEGPALDADCVACDLNCGSLFFLEPALDTGQTPPRDATLALEGRYGPRIGTLFPALRPPIA